MVSIFFDEEIKDEIDFLGKIMDEISDRAISRGLTPFQSISILSVKKFLESDYTVT